METQLRAVQSTVKLIVALVFCARMRVTFLLYSSTNYRELWTHGRFGYRWNERAKKGWPFEKTRHQWGITETEKVMNVGRTERNHRVSPVTPDRFVVTTPLKEEVPEDRIKVVRIYSLETTGPWRTNNIKPSMIWTWHKYFRTSL